MELKSQPNLPTQKQHIPNTKFSSPVKMKCITIIETSLTPKRLKNLKSLQPFLMSIITSYPHTEADAQLRLCEPKNSVNSHRINIISRDFTFFFPAPARKKKKRIKFRSKPNRDTPGSSKRGKVLQCTVSRFPARFCTKNGKITTETFEIERLTMQETRISLCFHRNFAQNSRANEQENRRRVYTLAHQSGDKLTFLPLLPFTFPTWGAWEHHRHHNGPSLTGKSKPTWWERTTM